MRLLAHLVRSAGKRVAYSSTDGVFRDDGVLVEAGDYSGFGGAARALAQEPDVAVLETARGGILLRGIGVLHNDVAVVTNISERDHLGLHGIDTLDQLAEVKASITKITRAEGWTVLNADDPRVLAMRRGATGRPWSARSTPATRPSAKRSSRAGAPRPSSTDDHGPRGVGRLAARAARGRAGHASRGLEAEHAERARGRLGRSASACPSAPSRAAGPSCSTRSATRAGANLFEWTATVGIDYAHNEAGMEGLVELCHGLRRLLREVWSCICAAGDRTDAILHAFAYRAARGADHLAIAEFLHYLRGRERADADAKPGRCARWRGGRARRSPTSSRRCGACSAGRGAATWSP